MKTILIILLSALSIDFAYSKNSEGQDKAKVRIYLEHFRSSESRQLSVRVLSKTEKRYLPTEGIEVDLYSSEISPSNLLGTVITEGNGTSTYTFTKEQIKLVKNLKTTRFFAVVNENETLNGKETDISIMDVDLTAQFTTEDSINRIYAHVAEKDSMGNPIPKKKVKIKFLVQRPLSPLPVGDEYNTTDENGNVSIEFPDDLPGDKDGLVKIYVRIVENDNYGTVEISETKDWGIPTFMDDNTLKRSLWASGANAPISLLLFINFLILGVWGMIFYIIFNIFRIKSLGN